jgi:hypothetical protein
MIPVSAKMGQLLAGLRDSRKLEKVAAVSSGQELELILLSKRAADSKLFETAKEAGVWDTVRNGAQAAWQHPLAGKALAGGAVAAGAAVPAVIAGNMMSDHATEQARNRALEAGVGLAGVGATMYGLHHMVGGNKTAGDEAADLEQALAKLAAVGYLDEQLTKAAADGSPQALELRDLNREFGIEILRNLTE